MIRSDSKVGRFLVKWIIFAWFIISNGFNLKNAVDDAKQTSRKLEWDIMNQDDEE